MGRYEWSVDGLGVTIIWSFVFAGVAGLYEAVCAITQSIDGTWNCKPLLAMSEGEVEVSEEQAIVAVATASGKVFYLHSSAQYESTQTT